MTSRAVFFDQDGVINADRSDFVKSWDELVVGQFENNAPCLLA